MSWRFANVVSIDEPAQKPIKHILPRTQQSLDLNLSPALANQVQNISNQMGIEYQNGLELWHSKRDELTSNLNMIRGIQDSYDDLRLVVFKVLELGTFVSGGDFDLLEG